MIKTFEKFTDEAIKELLAKMEANKDKPKLKVGDIVDLDWGHVARGARVFAKVTSTLDPADVAVVKTIICHRKPYLCDHEFEDLIRLYDTSKLADMDLYHKKMKDIEDYINPNPEIDPYSEENWDDNKYHKFKPWK